MKKRISYVLLACLLIAGNAKGQDDGDIDVDQLAGAEKTIEYAVSFLTIATDSRAGAMGDAGVATSPDNNSMHWNPAKYAFIKDDMGFSISYTPWLRNLVKDINLAHLAFFKRIDDQQTIAASLVYFSLGEIIFRNDFGDYNGQHSPNEFSIDIAYSRKFSEHISGGMAFRYIRSDLTGGAYIGGSESKAANAVAADLSMYYYNPDLSIADKQAELSFGVNVSNIGSKISYTEANKDFLPTQLRLGPAFKYHLDQYNSITGTFDISKFLVPSTPIYLEDESGNVVLDDNDNPVILKGKNPDVSVPQGILQSFYDAPGGLEEELHEIKYSFGVEYWYLNQFAVRGGYFTEHQNKGNRKYFSIGAGLKLNVFKVDFSYLIPQRQNNPLANTIRFTLGFDFEAYQNQKNESNN